MTPGRAGSCLVAAVCLGLGTAADPGPASSPEVVVADRARGLVYVAEQDRRRVTVLDAADETVRARFVLAAAPTGLALSADGARLYVTAGLAEGRVLVLDARRGEPRRELTVGHSPCAPAVDREERTLWVCNRFADEVTAIDLASGEVRARIPVPREPVALALTPDGDCLVVANLLPAGAATGAHGAAVTIIDAAAARVVANVPLPNGATGVRGLCLSPDGRFAYATHVIGRYGLPATQLDRGWVNTNAVSVVDVAARELAASVLLDDVDRGAANPWGVACSADGDVLCVAHSGTHEVSVIDRLALHRRIAAAAAGAREVAVEDDLAFLVGARRRIRLTGRGPRGLAVASGRVFVAEHFGDSVGVVEYAKEASAAPRSVPLGSGQVPDEVRRGAALFHDAELCFQTWQSCASCHPDGRVDGLNWDLANDGIGNPKNGKSLLLAHRTPPAMSTGVRDSAELAVRAGIRHIHVAVPDERNAAGIDEYLRSLQPVPSPRWRDAEVQERVRRGEQLFDGRGCIECHPPPLYTDLAAYDVGTGRGRGAGALLDTPTLVEVWRTAPYLHDGRAGTLREALRVHDAALRAPQAAPLSAAQLDDLEAFVSTR